MSRTMRHSEDRQPLTGLGLGAERLDVHNVADSPSDDDHLPPVSLAHTHDATHAPVSVVSVACKEEEQQLSILHRQSLHLVQSAGTARNVAVICLEFKLG